MTEDEHLATHGLRPRTEDLPAIRSVLTAESSRESGAQGEGDTELMKLCCVQLFNAGELADTLDSITRLETRKPKGISGWLGGHSLLVTTADGAAYGFSVNLGKWSADLTSALTARGREIHPTPQGMTVTLVPSGDDRSLS